MAYLEHSPGDPREIGPYRVVGQLDTDRMGQVYLGQSPGGRIVALRVLAEDLAADPEFRARLARDIAAAQRVSGEFTAAVVGADLDRARPWVASEYVPGPALGRLIVREGPLPARLLPALGAALGEGLRDIHAARVAHWGLKPSKVILGSDGPRIVGFGIAATQESALAAGSGGFLSPEQVRGDAVGPPSDVFSLGAVLAFAATGRQLFGFGQSTAVLLYQLLHSEPDLAAVPEAIRPVVRSCLAKDPRERPSAAQLAAACYGLAARDYGLDAAALRGEMDAISRWRGRKVAPPPARYAPPPARHAAEELQTTVREAYAAPETSGPETSVAPETSVGPGDIEPETYPEPEGGVPTEDDGWAAGSAPSGWGSPGPLPPPVAAPPAPASPAPAPRPPASPGYAPAPQAPAPAREATASRFLTGVLPERAPTDARLSLLVMITRRHSASPFAGLKDFPVPSAGTTVTITVSAPGLVPLGDLEQDLLVPFAADSEPVRFGFVTGPAGLHPVVVSAFSGGTFLGELSLQISVEPGAALEEGRDKGAVLYGLTTEPGEVTLQVSRTDEDRYSFQLIGEEWNRVEVTRRLAGDPTQVVGALVEELRAMSANESRFASPALVRNRIRNLGAQLWADVVPEAIRRQFWAQADRIRLFTIASDMDSVPWELLYPVDGDNENGFLVEQFPVVRRVYGQGRARALRLDSGAAYIVPPGSPANAMAEVDGVRGIFPGHVRNRGVCASLAGFTELLDSVPSVLHFACHNAFTEQSGSVITLDGGPLRPSDLAIAVQRRGLADISPLVFLNACRTAGDIAGLMQLMGWATQFMRAGAGAFVGSLWAVRSSSAKTYAEAFYRAMVSDGMPLGAASLRARQEIAGDPGDPTWLAYTVYGNPAASIAQGLPQ